MNEVFNLFFIPRAASIMKSINGPHWLFCRWILKYSEWLHILLSYIWTSPHAKVTSSAAAQRSTEDGSCWNICLILAVTKEAKYLMWALRNVGKLFKYAALQNDSAVLVAGIQGVLSTISEKHQMLAAGDTNTSWGNYERLQKHDFKKLRLKPPS